MRAELKQECDAVTDGLHRWAMHYEAANLDINLDVERLEDLGKRFAALRSEFDSHNEPYIKRDFSTVQETAASILKLDEDLHRAVDADNLDAVNTAFESIRQTCKTLKEAIRRITYRPNISFPDVPPEVIFENDSLSFQARADGKPVKCVIGFDTVVGLPCNDASKAKEAFESKKVQIRRTAESLIQAEKIIDGEILITRLA